MHSLKGYILRRVLISLLVIVLAAVFAFCIIRMVPGDPVRGMLGSDADESAVEAARKELNLDKPILTQLYLWFSDMLKGDLGRSLVLNRSIQEIFKARIPTTLSLSVPAFLIAMIFGCGLGIICAIHRGSAIDQILTVYIAGSNGVPIFWLAILMMYLFGTKLGWLPTVGYVSPSENFVGYLQSGIMPIMLIGLQPMATVARQVRTNMLEVMGQDYIRTSRAYGISEQSIKYKYALRNALIPVITVIGMQVPTIVGGSMLIEVCFSIAGMGRLIMTSVSNTDYLVIQALVLFIAIVVVLCNLAMDILYGLIDPRIRLSAKEA
ncbi:MAG: ABC transporter permease [Oscillospiraceae bacterium]|jgi:peptide/nickel transport system permease protein